MLTRDSPPPRTVVLPRNIDALIRVVQTLSSPVGARMFDPQIAREIVQRILAHER